MLPPAPHSIPLASLGHLSWPLLSFRPLRRISLTRGFLKTDAILHFLFNSILSEHYLSWPLRVRSRSAGLFFAFPPLSPLHLLLFFIFPSAPADLSSGVAFCATPRRQIRKKFKRKTPFSGRMKTTGILAVTSFPR